MADEKYAGFSHYRPRNKITGLGGGKEADETNANKSRTRVSTFNCRVTPVPVALVTRYGRLDLLAAGPHYRRVRSRGQLSNGARVTTMSVGVT